MPDAWVVLHPKVFMPKVLIKTNIISLPSWGNITTVSVVVLKPPYFTQEIGCVDMKSRHCTATFAIRVDRRRSPFPPLEPFRR